MRTDAEDSDAWLILSKGTSDLEQTGLTISQVADEVLYTGLLEMQELDLPEG